jgi:hypothetical protein
VHLPACASRAHKPIEANDMNSYLKIALIAIAAVAIAKRVPVLNTLV